MNTSILRLAYIRRIGARWFPWTGHDNGNCITACANRYRMPTGPNLLEGHYLPIKGTPRKTVKRVFWKRFAALRKFDH